MKEKVNDIKYLGCDLERLYHSNPVISRNYLRLYYNYIVNRYDIYKKRERGDSPPWTDDEIFLDYKFTNIRREHDKTTRWILDHISNNVSLSYEDRFYRTILFRLYNRIETAELINLDSKYFWNNIYDNAVKLDNTVEDVYTRAYKTVSIKYKHKNKYPNFSYKAHSLLYISDLAFDNKWEVPKEVEKNAESAVRWIKNIPGVGDFIGYQIFCDLTYINEYPISENEFTIAGPGCRAGIDLLFENRDKMTYEECIFWLRDNFDQVMKLIDKNYNQYNMFDNLEEYDRHMNVQSIENCFCEFSKYCYILEGRHKNPRKYNGREV